VIRAAPGYRPLIFWDVEREREKPLPPLFSVQDGSLILDGLEITLHSARPVSDARAAFVRVTRGDFQAKQCAFSVSGTHPSGVAVARLEGGKQGRAARSRLSRCFARGGSVIGLDLDGATRDVLLDDTLLIGGDGSLLESDVRSGNPLRFFLLRSTLLGRGTCMRIRSDDPTTVTTPTVEVNVWDTILSRYGPGRDGILVDIPAKLRTETIRWHANNSLYRGWKTLLRGPQEIAASDTAAWERLWSAFTANQRIETTSWPQVAFPETAVAPAADLSTSRTPGEPVGYASTSWPCLAPSGATAAPTIGCPVSLLLPARDRWMQWTVQRFVTTPIEVLTSGSAPEIPNPGDALYHGERIDLSRIDLGSHLERMQRTRGFGPRLVLHLHRSPEAKPLPSSPIRIRNTNVVLYLEALKTMMTPERLILKSKGESDGGRPAFIEIENGSLDIIGGEIRAEEYAHLIRVKKGNVRLHDAHVIGPLAGAPGHLEGAIVVQAGEPAAAVTLHQSVVASGRNALRVEGLARVRVAESAIVGGTDAIEFEPGTQQRTRITLSCVLETSTVAAGRAAIRIGKVSTATLFEEPILIQSRNCAFVNPFAEKAGVLLAEGDTLQRGLILWQGEQDCFDKRLHFSSASSVPEKSNWPGGWTALWGANGQRRSILAHPATNRFDVDDWQLSRLAITPPPPAVVGADLTKLRIAQKPTRPK
jgi:hypothetical protein